MDLVNFSLTVLGTSLTLVSLWLALRWNRLRVERNFGDLWDDLGKLKTRMDREGFSPDLIIGIPLGGLIIADLLHIRFYPDVPVMGIPLRRRRRDRALEVEVVPQVRLTQLEGMNILVVDDTTRSGRTMKAVTDYLRACGVGESALYTAVVAKLNGVTGYDVDFYAFTYERNLQFPWGKVPEDNYRDPRPKAQREPGSVPDLVSGALPSRTNVIGPQDEQSGTE